MTPQDAAVYQRISATRVAHAAGCTLTLLPAQGYSAADPTRFHTLGIALQRQTGVHAIGSDVHTDFDTRLGMSAYTPPGVDVYSESASGGEYLTLRWQHGAPAWAELGPARLALAATPRLIRLGFALRRHLVAGEHAGVEPLIEAWQAQFLAACSARAPATKGRQPPSTPSQAALASIARYLEQCVMQPECRTDLAHLAQRIDTTPLRLHRAFQQWQGMPPHAYFRQVRLHEARRLLAHTTLSLADIAASLGYAHQSHMGAELRAQLGITPCQYRSASQTILPDD